MSPFLTYIASLPIRTGMVSLALLASGQGKTEHRQQVWCPAPQVQLALSLLLLALCLVASVTVWTAVRNTLWTWRLKHDLENVCSWILKAIRLRRLAVDLLIRLKEMGCLMIKWNRQLFLCGEFIKLRHHQNHVHFIGCSPAFRDSLLYQHDGL